MRTLGLIGLTLVLAAGRMQAQTPAAIGADPPVDHAHPARMEVVHIPTHGVAINGVLYVATGVGPHPSLLLLHGLPGNEQNLDLAQAVRRAGWSVLTLHYRGSWGSPGNYSFTHAFEDAQSALDFMRDPKIYAKYGIDPQRLVVAGHSLGGMAASIVGAHNPGLAGVIMISAADFGVIASGSKPQDRADLATFMAGNMESLAGVTPAMMADEAISHSSGWNFVDYAPSLAQHPLLLITSDDGLAPSSNALATAVKKLGGPVMQVHLATDHSYSDRRIALESAVVIWLQDLPRH